MDFLHFIPKKKKTLQVTNCESLRTKVRGMFQNEIAIAGSLV